MATLTTGGTGFIGTELVQLLPKKGEKKVVVFHSGHFMERPEDIADHRLSVTITDSNNQDLAYIKRE